MLFKKLAGLLAGNTAVTLLVTGNEEAMTVTVIPKPSKTGEGMEGLATPLALTGSAAELDAEFCDLLEKFSNQRLSLAEQLEATTTVLEAAKRASAEKAAKAVAKSAKSATTKVAPVAGSSCGASCGDDETGGDGEDDGEGGTTAEAVGQQAQTTPSSNLFA